MKAQLLDLIGEQWAAHPASTLVDENKAQLVLCFAAKKELQRENTYRSLKVRFPNAVIALCSTSGEIYHQQVRDSSSIAAVLEFESTAIQAAKVSISNFANSCEAARALAKKLPRQGLAHILILADGSLVNGSELVKGLNESTGGKISVTGGLAGDGAEFRSTLVGLDGQPIAGQILAIGFYGDKLRVAHGSQGGWDMFGLEKLITRSTGNVLFEIDHKNALELYKKYLGPDAAQLPESALLFPLAVTIPGSAAPVVRTILSIDEENKSMIFAGDVPEGSTVRFMKANFDSLTAAAATAASQTLIASEEGPGFALLVSCVGRKLILGSRIDDEVDAVAEAFGTRTLLAGFYSYGEISPFNEGGDCQLHNQTMTITSFYELP